MRIFHQRFIWCAVLVLLLSLNLCAQMAPTATEATAQPAPPATLQEAQAAYNTRVVEENIRSYAIMAGSFFNSGWYTICIEQCDQILQRWPEDKTMFLIRVVTLKSRCFARLNRWEEAYDTLTSFNQKHMHDNKVYEPATIPYNFFVHDSVLLEKILLLQEEGKYHEAALTVEQRIDLRLNRDDAEKFPTLHLNVELPEEAAYWYCQAGEYDTALAKYRDILTYMDTHTPDTWSQSRYRLKQYYVIPLGVAACQLQAGQYDDALETYDAIATQLNDRDIREQMFVTISMTIKPGADTADILTPSDISNVYDIHATYNEVIAHYFMSVDLPLRRIACLIQAGDKIRASALLTSIEILLSDENFVQMAATIVGEEYRHDKINRLPLAPDITQLLPVTIPALKKEIEALHSPDGGE